LYSPLDFTSLIKTSTLSARAGALDPASAANPTTSATATPRRRRDIARFDGAGPRLFTSPR
jgi:hypothetical protein